MKALKRIHTLALIACITSPVLAESIDVRVTGIITPAACTPTLAGGGVIDYGKIPINSLSQTDYTLLAEKQLDFAITCDAPTKVAVKATNGRPDTLAGATEGAGGFGISPVSGMFGLMGKAGSAGLGMAGDAKIGGYGLRIQSDTVTLDGNTAHNIVREAEDTAWISSGTSTGAGIGSLLSSTGVREVSWAEQGTDTPKAFTTMSGKLGVQAFINKTSELDLTQPVTLDGLTTIELVYL